MGATLNEPAVQLVHTLLLVAVQTDDDVPLAHAVQAVQGAEPLPLKVEPSTQAWPRASGSAAAASSSSAGSSAEGRSRSRSRSMMFN